MNFFTPHFCHKKKYIYIRDLRMIKQSQINKLPNIQIQSNGEKTKFQKIIQNTIKNLLSLIYQEHYKSMNL